MFQGLELKSSREIDLFTICVVLFYHIKEPAIAKTSLKGKTVVLFRLPI